MKYWKTEISTITAAFLLAVPYGAFAGGINNWFHFSGLSDKDTVYSLAAVNVSEGLELVMPDVGKDRFLSIHILDENHMPPFYLYGGGKRTFTADYSLIITTER